MHAPGDPAPRMTNEEVTDPAERRELINNPEPRVVIRTREYRKKVRPVIERPCARPECPIVFTVKPNNPNKTYCCTGCCNKHLKRPSTKRPQYAKRFCGIRGTKGISI